MADTKNPKLARHLNYQSTQSNGSALSMETGSIPSWTHLSVDQHRDSELFTQIQELYKDVDSTAEFVCGVNEILCTTIPSIVLLVLLGFFHVAQISVGVRYLEQCPIEPKVPVFLFVGGCFGLLNILHSLYNIKKMRKHSESQYGENGKSPNEVKLVDCMLNIFLLSWHLVGAVWTLSVWYPNFVGPLYEPDNYCEMTAYIFAVISLGVFAGLLALRLLFHGCLAVCYKYTDVFEGV